MILTPSRQIIVPSLGSFIDRVRRNFAPMHMMAHLKKGPGGHLLKNAAGHLVKGCGALPCSACTGTHASVACTLTVPNDLQLVAIPGGCTIGAADGAGNPVSTDIDGTSLILPQVGGLAPPLTNCVYRDFIGPFARFYYNGFGPPGYVTPWYIEVAVYRFGTEWNGYAAVVGDDTGASSPLQFLTDQAFLTTANCDDPFTLTNGIEYCVGWSGVVTFDCTPL